MLRHNKGITLIALIITVIVLLILAAVSIDVVIGDGLFDKAGNTVSKTNSKIAQQQGIMNILQGELQAIDSEQIREGENEQTSEGETGGNQAGGGTTGGNQAGGNQTGGGETGGNTAGGGDSGGNQPETPIAEAGKKASETLDYTSNEKTAVIPGGFTVSGVPSESTIDGGLVIYLIDDKSDSEIAAINWNDSTTVDNLQRTYDQFVWIPVDDINDMYMCQNEDGTKSCRITVEAGVAKCTTHNSTQMAGRLYHVTTGDEFYSTLTTQTYTTGSRRIREPDVVTNAINADGNSTYLSQLTKILGAGYNTTDNFKQRLQEEYNEIVKSVYLNKGFYVGRYETSGMVNSDTNATIKVVAGTTNGIHSVTWYRMYAQAKQYAANKTLITVGSGMIQGAAYDQVMKFVSNGTRPDGAQYSITESGNVGHNTAGFKTRPYPTGGRGYSTNYTGTEAYNDCVKNIYDLEGNVWAWTTEAYDSVYRVHRGGNIGNSLSACNRSDTNPVRTGVEWCSTIEQLYVK